MEDQTSGEEKNQRISFIIIPPCIFTSQILFWSSSKTCRNITLMGMVNNNWGDLTPAVLDESQITFNVYF